MVCWIVYASKKASLSKGKKRPYEKPKLRLLCFVFSENFHLFSIIGNGDCWMQKIKG
jgi:hypothetical protein